MEKWYTLHTKPNSEYQVAAALQERGLETFLPEIEAPKKSRGRKYQPFFPCYLFAKIDFQAVGLSQIQWTPGLRRLVAFGERPTPLPDRLIDLIRRKVESIESSGGWQAHPFRAGDTVRITEGPFEDMLAIFDGPPSPSERVQVLLTFLGRTSRLQVDVADLEKANPPDPKTTPPKRRRRTRGRGRRIN